MPIRFVMTITFITGLMIGLQSARALSPDGAFGVTAGMTVDDLNVVGSHNTTYVIAPAEPDPDLVLYSVGASPQGYVCSLFTMGPVVSRSELDRIQRGWLTRMIRIYGVPSSGVPGMGWSWKPTAATGLESVSLLSFRDARNQWHLATQHYFRSPAGSGCPDR